MRASLKSMKLDFQWNIEAKESLFKSETLYTFNDKESFLKVNATKTHLVIDSNFIKPFTAEAKVCIYLFILIYCSLIKFIIYKDFIF